MRTLAPITLTFLTCLIVVWMVSFGPKVGRIWSDEPGPSPSEAAAASDAGHSGAAPAPSRLNSIGR